MSKRLMAAVTVAALAVVTFSATAQAGGMRGDQGVRKGCYLTHMMTRTKKLFTRPVTYRKTHTKWRLFGRHRKGH
ncbi:MAG: hypothetical protein ACR2OF_06265 [Hyphomicrobium sp.]